MGYGPDDTQEMEVSITCPHCKEDFDQKVEVGIYYKTDVDVTPVD